MSYDCAILQRGPFILVCVRSCFFLRASKGKNSTPAEDICALNLLSYKDIPCSIFLTESLIYLGILENVKPTIICEKSA